MSYCSLTLLSRNDIHLNPKSKTRKLVTFVLNLSLNIKHLLYVTTQITGCTKNAPKSQLQTAKT